jgi:hypothetical protein
MTANEFITWFKGFVAAANTFNITPKQWDIICEQLEKVNNVPNKGAYKISIGDEINGMTTSTTSEIRQDTTYKNDNYQTKTLLND